MELLQGLCHVRILDSLETNYASQRVSVSSLQYTLASEAGVSGPWERLSGSEAGGQWA
jgi:hypothetical protein